jgi:hypothetical protein
LAKPAHNKTGKPPEEERALDFPKRTGPALPGPVRFVISRLRKKSLAEGNEFPVPHLSPSDRRLTMLVERGLGVMNVELVSEAYAIAANYLRRSGAIPDTLVTDEHLLEIVVKLLQHGEFNRIRLANKAIVRFEAQSEAKAVA